VSGERQPTEGVLQPGDALAITLTAGERLRIVNREGGQVVDTWALNLHDPDEHMSMEHTRTALSKLVPEVGDDLFSCRRRPLLRLTEDTSPGVHDTLIAACDPERYRQLGADGEHASCVESYKSALAARNIRAPVVPAPLNLFMNIPWQADGTLAFQPAPARPGDHVVLAAAMDAIVVLSVCPMDLNPVNGGSPTAIGFEMLAG
jgi:uncharacterized protein YcgI (DUF1989 family)